MAYRGIDEVAATRAAGPDFGSRTEARSLQTLELVLQTVQAATHRDDLPKTLPSYAVISGK